MRCYVALIFFFLILKVSAQDTIHFRNGDIKAVKVKEIGIDEVSFYHFGEENRDIITEKKNAIAFIKYKDGYVDSIPKTNTSENKPSTHKIIIKGNKLEYCQKTLTDRAFIGLIDECLNTSVRSTMKSEFNVMREYNRRHNNLGTISGIAFLGGVFYGGLFYYLLGAKEAAIFAGIGGVVCIGTGISANINKKNYQKQRTKIAFLYNSLN